MKITTLGHAGLKVDTARASVLLDPWFSPEGTFQASWFQFPDNSHLFRPELLHPTAIAISHEHMDHVDPWFLARVSPEVPVYVPQYPSPVLRRKIDSAKVRTVVEVPQWERIEIGEGTSLLFVSETSPMNHDSAIVIQGDGDTLLDMNDARLDPVQLREISRRVGGTIDVLALQGSGASWYPFCYSYPERRRRELSRHKRSAKLAHVERVVQVVGPTTLLPFAGPACFLDPKLFHLNAEMEDGIFPDQQQVVEWLAGRGIENAVVLLPGDAWDTGEGVKDPDPFWDGFRFADLWRYLKAYADRRRPFIQVVLGRYRDPESSLWDRFEDYFLCLLEMSPYFNGKIGMRVGFEITGPGGGSWAVDFRSGSEGVFRQLGECSYVFRFASRWLPPILEGRVPWEDFLLSCRFEAWRDPDRYNDHLLGLLKFAEPEGLQKVERFETSMEADDRIKIYAEGRMYSVQRHCPHAGNDLLATGEVLPARVLRCLAHHYEFDLETGQSLNANLELDVEPIEEDEIRHMALNRPATANVPSAPGQSWGLR